MNEEKQKEKNDQKIRLSDEDLEEVNGGFDLRYIGELTSVQKDRGWVVKNR